MSVFLVAALLVLALPAAAAEKVKEKSTGVEFAAHSEDGLALLGVGVRKKLVFNVYAAAFYVQPEEFRQVAADGSEKAANRSAWKGSLKRRMILHFVRNVPADKIREAFNDSLTHNMSKEDFEAEQENIKTFLDSVSKVNKGETFTFESKGNTVAVFVRGKRIFKATSKRLMRGMWGSYFGKRPIDEKLRKNLLKRRDVVLKGE